jgi:hypothetical protein
MTDFIRGLVQNPTPLPKGGTSPLQLMPSGALHVQTITPPMFEWARAQKLYGANTGAGTAKAPVTAMPTTTATWALYNGYTGKYLVVTRIYNWSVSGTLGLGMSLIAGLSTAAQSSAPTAYSSSVHAALQPGSPTTQGVFANAVTLAGAPVWAVEASRDQVSAVSVGSGLTADVQGKYIIPPSYALGAAVLAPAGTSALFGVGFEYYVADLSIGG